VTGFYATTGVITIIALLVWMLVLQSKKAAKAKAQKEHAEVNRGKQKKANEIAARGTERGADLRKRMLERLRKRREG
jgi:Flp pilus assembly protein TadB